MPRKMKDSGVEWLGQVPEGWQISSIKRHYQIVLGKMLSSERGGECDSLEKYFCAANVHFDGGADASNLKEMWFSPEEKKTYKVNEGDLLVVEGGAGAGGAAIVKNLQFDAYVQNSILIVRGRDRSANSYAGYLLEFLVKSGYVDYVSNKATIPHFTKEKVGGVPLPVPPLPEQRAIAAYLDERCAKIDTMIAEAKETIEEYKQWKQSLIFEAVTGKREIESGKLRVESELRDSGVEWLGQVPEGWRVCRLKDVASIHTGSTPDRSMQEYFSRDSGLPWIKAENLGTECPIESTTEYLTETGVAVGRKFPSKTVYVCCIASVGKVGFAEIEASCNQQINALLFKSGYDYKFGFYSMVAAEDEYNVRASGNVVKILNSTLQGMIKIPYPPLPEQRAIAAYLDRKCAAIDRVVAEKEGLIADLEQYKKSLIFECVTGKREVA